MPKLSCAAGSTSAPRVRLYYIIGQAAEAEPRSQRRRRPFLEGQIVNSRCTAANETARRRYAEESNRSAVAARLYPSCGRTPEESDAGP